MDTKPKRKLSVLFALLAAGVLFMLAPAVSEAAVTMEEATAIAVEKYPGEVIKMEKERGRYEFRIKTDEGKTKKVYVYTNANDGTVLEKESKSKTTKKSMKITLEEAEAIALKEFPGEVKKVEFERGRYEVKIKPKSETVAGDYVEVHVDGDTGEVVKTKVKSRKRSNDRDND